METLTLEQFCREAGDVAASAPAGDIPARIADRLPGLLADHELLAPRHRAAREGGYRRNVMFVCPGARFSVLAVVWPPGVATPIHDHKTWCAFGVYQGEIRETRYDPAEDATDCTRAVERAVVAHGCGAVGHMACCGDIHSMRNAGRLTAISIHVYGGDSERMGPNLERIYKL